MRLIYLAAATGVALALLTACDREREVVTERREIEPTPPATVSAEPVTEERERLRTFETSGVVNAINEFRAEPTAENKADVDKAFAELDKEIAELQRESATFTGDEKAEADRKLAELQTFRTEQTARYTGERAERGADAAGEALKDAARDAGRAIENTGEAIKKAVP